MAKILVVATHASDDLTKSSLAFITAVGALTAGKEVALALLGEAVYLTKQAVAQGIQGVGFPPLPQLIEQVSAYSPCCRRRSSIFRFSSSSSRSSWASLASSSVCGSLCVSLRAE
jgi:DsrE/DsrF-like family